MNGKTLKTTTATSPVIELKEYVWYFNSIGLLLELT